ncbi:MAG: putative quinol monooxygenase [Acidimicrobiales bacterium]|jgi:quinol monooxygenase YgiN
MSCTAVTRFHSKTGQEDALVELLIEGRNRMQSAEGCESFDVLRDEADAQSLMFVQQWSSHGAHDAAFAELILQSGHLEMVLATLDEPIVQNIYEVVS